jgi:hypothetical protein
MAAPPFPRAGESIRNPPQRDALAGDGRPWEAGQQGSLGEGRMARGEVCGNDYDKTFTITRGQRTGTFDCFA